MHNTAHFRSLRTCLQEAHEPCDCDLWERWKEVISKMDVGMGLCQHKTELLLLIATHICVLVDNAVDIRVFQSEKWILGHTKPCPMCK